MTHRTFGEYFRYPKLEKYEGLEGNIPLRYGDIFMGVEVEAEEAAHVDYIPGSFRAVQDGSLKVNGMEFVTVPIKAMYLEKELERLFAAIPRASFSCRTSIHVHMNARDFTIQNVLDFVMLYTLFEKPLYKYSGNRWKNNFCIPLQAAPHHLSSLMSYLGESPEQQLERFGHVNFRWSKYLGLNLGPLAGNRDQSGRYGTIEFRQMKGNNNIPYIIDWCNLITCMKFYTRSVDSNELLKTILDNRGHELAAAVFRDWTPLIMSDKESVNDIKKANTFLKYCIGRAGVNRRLSEPVTLSPRPMVEESIITDEDADEEDMPQPIDLEWVPIGTLPAAPDPSSMTEVIEAHRARIRRNLERQREEALTQGRRPANSLDMAFFRGITPPERGQPLGSITLTPAQIAALSRADLTGTMSSSRTASTTTTTRRRTA